MTIESFLITERALVSLKHTLAALQMLSYENTEVSILATAMSSIIHRVRICPNTNLCDQMNVPKKVIWHQYTVEEQFQSRRPLRTYLYKKLKF